MKSHYTPWVLLALALSSCGSERDFDSGTGAPTAGGGDGNQTPTTTGAALAWYLPCPGTAGTPPTPAEGQQLFVGPGPHKIGATKYDGSELKILGEVCQPNALARDIVFIIDTSNSMLANTNGNNSGAGCNGKGCDPIRYVNGNITCGRLEAVRQVMTQLKNTNVRFAFTTFSDSSAIYKSSNFFTDPSLALDDFSGINKDIGAKICAGNGGTDYAAGLKAGAEVFAGARSSANLEIYFISDGKPENVAAAQTAANEIRANGVAVQGKAAPVKIGTIMLGNETDDSVLKNYVASSPDLHARADKAAELVNALTNLAANTISRGTIKRRNAKVWEPTDLQTVSQNFKFELDPVDIHKADNPEGIEVQIEYFDKREQKYTTTGKLLWE